MIKKTSSPRALFIAGPTASGKSAIALAIAEAVGGCIINADSMQVYDQLQLLTARPSAADMARVPHQVYGHIDPCVAYSVGQWQSDALAAIAQAHAKQQIPIIIGGTGLYFKALSDGLAAIPETPAPIRAALRQRLKQQGAEALHAQLRQCDAALAARLQPQDGQRIIRGLEVYEATGQPLSQWQQQPTQSPLDFPVAEILLMPERSWLYGRCDQRFVSMIEQGALDEVAALAARQLSPDLPAMKALGVAELIAYQSGDMTLEQAIAQAQQQTRRYAKRQMTWFRNQMISWNHFSEQDYEHKMDKIFSFISKIGLTSG
jgi:tRNA dimethylallyltransferase